MNTLLDDYRLLKQRPAAKQHENLDHFVVEGPRIIQRLLACGYTIRSIIVQCGKPHEVLGELPSEVPIFDLTREQMSELAGFDFHRGYLASAVRRPFSDPTTVPVKDPLMLGLFGITDMENMGSLLRSAAAFGVSKVFLDHASVDPYSRRVCRVSMGASLSMQYFLMDEPGVVLPQLHSKGITSLAATPSETAT
ncbi:MAG: TrmH family RNA methyltransferase, partial [Planctomycetota bacterium]